MFAVTRPIFVGVPVRRTRGRLAANYRTEVNLYVVSTPDDPGSGVELGWTFGSDAPAIQVGGDARGRFDGLNVRSAWRPPVLQEESISGGKFLVAWQAKRYGTQPGDTPGFVFSGWEIDSTSRNDQSGQINIPRGNIRADKKWKGVQVGPSDADSPAFYVAYRAIPFADDLPPE